MREITYNDIMHLNSGLYGNEIYYKLEFVDGENVAVTSLGACACDGKRGDFEKYVEEYFMERGLIVQWASDRLNFTVKEKVIRVVAAAIVDNKRVFATQRGYGSCKDGWEFPGGKIESGETPEQALRREIIEELDTEIEVGELIDTVEYDYPGFHLSVNCFLCKVVSGNLVLKEHEAAKWLGKEEVYSVDWLPADVQIVEKIKELL